MHASLPRPARLFLFLLLAAVAVPRPAHATWPHDPTVNLALSGAGGDQLVNSAIPDGAGGAIVAWADNHAGTYDIYATRITAAGTVAPGWPANGLLVCGAGGNQFNPVMVSDGSGGAILAWEDGRFGAANRDVFAARVNANGTFTVGWPADGRELAIVNPADDEYGPDIASDGAGGAIVVWTLVFGVGDNDVYAARVTSGGTVSWSGPQVAPGSLQEGVAVVSDGAGGAILSYEDNQAGNFDIRAQRVNSSGGFVWGAPVCTFAADQRFPHEVSDGAGGAIVCWTDTRSGTNDLYAMRLTSSGSASPGWFTGGNAVAATGGSQQAPVMVPDGNHGAVIAWLDTRFATSDIFAQHIQGGAPAPGWPINGVELDPSGYGSAPVITPDGAGGAIVAWADSRTGVSNDIYATRITSIGGLGAGWTYGGTPISTAAAGQILPVITSDGGGGAILAWSDARNGGGNNNVYAQRVDLFGQLGSAEPSFVSLHDVGGDQGGRVRLVWNSSYLDADPVFGVGAYWIWRQAPLALAEAAVERGGAWLDARIAASAATVSPREWSAIAGRGLFTTTTTNGTAFAWEYVASQPASGFPQYSYVAATTRDSLPGSNPYTTFMVQARSVSGPAYWSSAPDSTYSVDNLPPLPPAPFTGAYSGGSTALHWGPNLETDFAVYRLYRGNSAGFVPGPSNFVVEKPDTGFLDTPGPPSYYKLGAVDVHGNVSAYALLAPSGTLDAPGTRTPSVLSLAPVSPNPVPGRATFHFALPHETAASLRIYDVSGRLVRELAHGTLPAGDHASFWDGRDAGGQEARGGVYFVELSSEGRRLRARFVSIR